MILVTNQDTEESAPTRVRRSTLQVDVKMKRASPLFPSQRREQGDGNWKREIKGDILYPGDSYLLISTELKEFKQNFFWGAQDLNSYPLSLDKYLSSASHMKCSVLTKWENVCYGHSVVTMNRSSLWPSVLCSYLCCSGKVLLFNLRSGKPSKRSLCPASWNEK